MSEIDFIGAVFRGGASAVAVAVLLLAARRWGRDKAGLLAGLPSVTGPAMVWLALDQGSEFAEHAAQGAIAAGVPCALFALAYAWLAPRRGRTVALLGASTACLSGFLLLSGWDWPTHWMLVTVAMTCACCLALLPCSLHPATHQPPVLTPRSAWCAPASPRHSIALRAATATALVSGAVSALACLSAQAVGPQWAGALTSPPLLAAAVALELHRQGCAVRVRDFLRGYIAGLVGRSVFVAVFGGLLIPLGLVWALSASVAVALLLGLCTLRWMQWRQHVLVAAASSPSNA